MGEFRPSRPGERRGGRQKGTPNKTDKSIKEMVLGALVGVGGAEYLMRQAEKNPTAFLTLVGRVLPLQVTGEAGGPIAIDFRWADAPVAIAAPPPVTIDAEPDEPLTVTFEHEPAK